jgi:hypothetical protein
MLRAKDVIRVSMGHYTIPLDFPRAPDLQGAVIVVTAYLIRHPDGPILLDTGFAKGHATAEALFHPVIRPFDEAMRELSLRIEDVRARDRRPGVQRRILVRARARGLAAGPGGIGASRLRAVGRAAAGARSLARHLRHDLAIWERGT